LGNCPMSIMSMIHSVKNKLMRTATYSPLSVRAERSVAVRTAIAEHVVIVVVVFLLWWLLLVFFFCPLSAAHPHRCTTAPIDTLRLAPAATHRLPCVRAPCVYLLHHCTTVGTVAAEAVPNPFRAHTRARRRRQCQ